MPTDAILGFAVAGTFVLYALFFFFGYFDFHSS